MQLENEISFNHMKLNIIGNCKTLLVLICIAEYQRLVDGISYTSKLIMLISGIRY